jgi:hypothetical protein
MGFAGGAMGKPTMRSAFMFGLLPELLDLFIPSIVDSAASATELYILYSVSNLLRFGFWLWWMLNALKGLAELKGAANNPALPRWPIFIPIYQWIFWMTTVRAEVQKAKQMRGLQPTSRSAVLYFFFPVFALQNDLNDLAAAP